jgi:hypothetical protein
VVVDIDNVEGDRACHRGLKIRFGLQPS